MWKLRLVSLGFIAIGLSGCASYYFYPTGEAACLEVIREDDPFAPKDYSRWLRRWQASPWCQAVRARWFASMFVPPPVTPLLDVHPLRCSRNGGVVEVRVRFVNSGTSSVDPFDVTAGSDPTQPPGPHNAGEMTPVDLQGNPTGPVQYIPGDLTGNDPVPLEPTPPANLVDLRVLPDVTPPSFPVRLDATVVARIGGQIIGLGQKSCRVN